MNPLLKDLLLQRPMKADPSQTLEARLLNEVMKQKQRIDVRQGVHDGRGDVVVEEESFTLRIMNHYDSWMPNDPQDGDYIQYGKGSYTIPFNKADWTGFNRLCLDVSVNAIGYINPHIIVAFTNDGDIKVPDIYNREGYHGINLENGLASYVIDISDLPRDAITSLSFIVMAGGKDLAAIDEQAYTISNLSLGLSENESRNKGWQPHRPIVYPHNGYQTTGRKYAITTFPKGTPFTLEKDGVVVYEGVVSEDNFKQTIAEFSAFEEIGQYQLHIEDEATQSFAIGERRERWYPSLYKSLNFIACQRCGTHVHGVHCTCHNDVIAKYKDAIISFNGGWHDAGDLSQQLIQSAELTESLLDLALAVKTDEDFHDRLIAECEWGIDFIFKTRFEDGNRATSAGVSRWSNGRIGDFDDSFARVHNTALENFILAKIESVLAQKLPANNRLKPRLARIAIEDYDFAMAAFKEYGYKTTPIYWEHTYSTAPSLYEAIIVNASIALYEQTNDKAYYENAKASFAKMIACQHDNDAIRDRGHVVKGFFYRDAHHRVVNHFNHQAREHYYAQAFAGMLTHCRDNTEWQKAAKNYADYLIYCGTMSNAYGMAASGVYHRNETDDKEGFDVQHLLTSDEIYEDYQKQLDEGIQINENWVLKRFPVWFSFRGNNGILLSHAKASSVMHALIDDQRLYEVSENQLNWVIGMNPFGQSLMYGEGHDYAQQYTVQSGEMVGEIPVGVQTFADEDEPYWSQFNNATYKEVWTGLAGKWMSIVADLINDSKGERDE